MTELCGPLLHKTYAVMSVTAAYGTGTTAAYIRWRKKNDNTLPVEIFQKLSTLWFLYLVYIMTETFYTFVENFSFVGKKNEGTPSLLKSVARICSAENDYNAIDIFRLIEQVIGVASASIANCLQSFFPRQNRLSNFIRRYFSPFLSDFIL